MRIAWPLTGRSEELEVIEAGLSDPEIGGIVICGPDAVSEYVGVEEAALDGLYRVAEAKLAAAQRLYDVVDPMKADYPAVVASTLPAVAKS